MDCATYLFSCTSERKKNKGNKWEYNELPNYNIIKSKLE